MQTHDERLEALVREIRELGHILHQIQFPDQKFCLSVEELATRWDICAEGVRRLVRNKKLRPIRGLGKHRFTLDEIRRFEQQDDAVDKRNALMGRRPRN